MGTFSGAFVLDGMRSSENIKFTTLDRDNDSASNNCAAQYESGWWYNNCYYW
ncbi:hypothetical protein KR215_010996 [Drosophila sulfurigaster]|nr:hypothetical protein KR215_010981 [Drosophila sulfurigaster]KAH8391298.1 hypothetical protein KR215_010996 [Drosophila sulfurigaster]